MYKKSVKFEKYSSFRNSSISEINSWVDAVDQEHSLRETRRTEIMKDGLKIVTDFIENDVTGAKKMSKVCGRFLNYSYFFG